MGASEARKRKQSQTVKQIDTRSLVAGDIIATRSNTVGSGTIRIATRGPVSHAILYTGHEFAVDAMPDRGVTTDRLHNKLSDVSYAAVFRHKMASTVQCADACQWAELQAQLNKPYDFTSAVRTGRPKYTTVGTLIVLMDEAEALIDQEGEDASFMCSELVFRAFEIAGSPITSKPAHLLSPGMVFKTDRLEMMGTLV